MAEWLMTEEEMKSRWEELSDLSEIDVFQAIEQDDKKQEQNTQGLQRRAELGVQAYRRLHKGPQKARLIGDVTSLRLELEEQKEENERLRKRLREVEGEKQYYLEQLKRVRGIDVPAPWEEDMSTVILVD